MQNFIKRPSIDLYPGIRVYKETVLEYKNDNVKQTVKDLVLHTIAKVNGEGYESTYDTTIQLQEGDILIFDGEIRGYIKPLEAFCEAQDAINELEIIKDLG